MEIDGSCEMVNDYILERKVSYRKVIGVVNKMES